MSASRLADERAPLLSGIAHGFFGRAGGVSTGPFATLNAGLRSADDPAHVAENRKRICQALGATDLLTLHQTHSATALFVDAPFLGARPQADALVTNQPGLAIGALAADCVPVLFAGQGLVAAAHAGWRGSLGGVLEATVQLLAAHGARPAGLVCAIGPCLRAPAFEAGEDLREAFLRKYPDSDAFLTPGPRPGKYIFDHLGFVIWRLTEAGVPRPQIDVVGGCTLTENDRYFSYRGSQQAGQSSFGLNLSAICCPGA